ncbi:MAG: hypothetical protein WDN24_05560 [Sphingomonas sp.]
MLTPATGIAQTARGYYAATPVTAPEKASVVTRTTVWKCATACAWLRRRVRATRSCASWWRAKWAR